MSYKLKKIFFPYSLFSSPDSWIFNFIEDLPVWCPPAGGSAGWSRITYVFSTNQHSIFSRSSWQVFSTLNYFNLRSSDPSERRRSTFNFSYSPYSLLFFGCNNLTLYIPHTVNTASRTVTIAVIAI